MFTYYRISIYMAVVRWCSGMGWIDNRLPPAPGLALKTIFCLSIYLMQKRGSEYRRWNDQTKVRYLKWIRYTVYQSCICVSNNNTLCSAYAVYTYPIIQYSFFIDFSLFLILFRISTQEFRPKKETNARCTHSAHTHSAESRDHLTMGHPQSWSTLPAVHRPVSQFIPVLNRTCILFGELWWASAACDPH